MGVTVSKFVNLLKSKELNKYSLPELQVHLQTCHDYYERFKNPDERIILNSLWNKMGAWYNEQLVTKHPQARVVYPFNYLLNTYGEGTYPTRKGSLGKRKAKVS